MKYFTIYDKKADGWDLPFPQTTRATAMRMCQENLSKNELMSNHSEDFQLFETGHFDQSKGKTIGLEDPEFVCDLSDFRTDGHGNATETSR